MANERDLGDPSISEGYEPSLQVREAHLSSRIQEVSRKIVQLVISVTPLKEDDGSTNVYLSQERTLHRCVYLIEEGGENEFMKEKTREAEKKLMMREVKAVQRIVVGRIQPFYVDAFIQNQSEDDLIRLLKQEFKFEFTQPEFTEAELNPSTLDVVDLHLPDF